MNAAGLVIHSPSVMSAHELSPDDRARARLLRAGEYRAPRVIGTIDMTAACAPISCGPGGGPCGPDTCAPSGGPCGPDGCMPNA